MQFYEIIKLSSSDCVLFELVQLTQTKTKEMSVLVLGSNNSCYVCDLADTSIGAYKTLNIKIIIHCFTTFSLRQVCYLG